MYASAYIVFSTNETIMHTRKRQLLEQRVLGKLETHKGRAEVQSLTIALQRKQNRAKILVKARHGNVKLLEKVRKSTPHRV